MKREYYPTNSLPAWLRFNGVTTNGVTFQKLSSAENTADKGTAIVATESRTSKESDTRPEVLLRVPSDLVLSLEAVHGYGKVDENFREVLDAVGGFGMVCIPKSLTV